MVLCKVIMLSLIISIIIISILYCLESKKDIDKYMYAPYELFTQIKKEQQIDRTILYGNLFLDNLDKQIINMTNPPVKYNSKRIELNRYSDMLL